VCLWCRARGSAFVSTGSVGMCPRGRKVPHLQYSGLLYIARAVVAQCDVPRSRVEMSRTNNKSAATRVILTHRRRSWCLYAEVRKDLLQVPQPPFLQPGLLQ
jgi:hypothetical protein